MKILLPRELILWLDLHRGDMSRQAMIIKTLIDLKNSKYFNTKEQDNEDNSTRERS